MTAAGFHKPCRGKRAFVDEATAKRHGTNARLWHRCERCGLIHAGAKAATPKTLAAVVAANIEHQTAELTGKFERADAQLRTELAQLGKGA